MTFPAYPEYKDSGLEWLGTVPDHWVDRKIARDVPFSVGWTPPSGKDEYYDGGHCWVTIADFTGPVIYDTQSKITDLAVSARDALPVPQGSLLFSFKLSVGLVAFLGIPAYTNEAIAAFWPNENVDLKFWSYAAPIFVPQYARPNIYGAPLLNQELIRSVRFFAPSIEEQRVIASFLDHETARIDALIEEQQRLIELLKEKRQAVISHAVTKGLDRDVPMKDSGVEWLGEVPAHWEVLKLGHVTVDKCDGPFGSALKSEHYTDEGVRVIRLQNIRSGWFDDTDKAYIAQRYYYEEIGRGAVKPGDLLIAGLGDERNSVGRACVAPKGIEPAMVKADCFRFSLDVSRADAKFVAIQLSAGSEADAGVLANGSTRSRIPLLTMSARKVALPPKTEQSEILEFVKKETHRLDSLLVEAEATNTLLRERRSAVIFAAVTGKIDIRDWEPPQYHDEISQRSEREVPA